MMCQRIGRPPISTIGFGFREVSSDRREPSPPARMSTFIIYELHEFLLLAPLAPVHQENLSGNYTNLSRIVSIYYLFIDYGWCSEVDKDETACPLSPDFSGASPFSPDPSGIFRDATGKLGEVNYNRIFK
jgi:hypothetical protein